MPASMITNTKIQSLLPASFMIAWPPKAASWNFLATTTMARYRKRCRPGETTSFYSSKYMCAKYQFLKGIACFAFTVNDMVLAIHLVLLRIALAEGTGSLGTVHGPSLGSSGIVLRINGLAVPGNTTITVMRQDK